MASNRKTAVQRRDDVIDNDSYTMSHQPVVSNSLKIKLDHLKTFEALTKNQQKFFDAYKRGDYFLGLLGSPGVGKTFLALYRAIEEVLDKTNPFEHVVVVRSAVQVRDQGFVPGTLEEKMEIYEVPYKEICETLFGRKDAWDRLKEQSYARFISTTAIRGISIDNSIIIVDECFPRNQNILTDDGQHTMGYLFDKFRLNKKLPLVKSFNEKTGSFEYKQIKNVFHKGEQKLVQVELNKIKFKCTANHKFLTECGWTEASNLKSGDLVISTKESMNQSLKKLNGDQLQLVLGSFLGDGCVRNVGLNTYRLTVIHGIAQKDYCLWKSNFFDSRIEELENNGYSQKPAVRFNTKCFAIGDDFPKTKTHCPQWILDKLDARGIAIWFMDDGSASPKENMATLSTCSFDEGSQKRIVQKFLTLGIDCHYVNYKKKNGKSYFSIRFGKDGYNKLCELIAPYMHENLSYKMRDCDQSTQKYNWNKIGYDYGLSVVNKVINLDEKSEVFDIEVEDNHNFVVTSRSKAQYGIVAHNCQSMTFHELNSVISRVGHRSKIIFIGDLKQNDLIKSRNDVSGLQSFLDVARHMNEFSEIQFTPDDIVRSSLVKSWIVACDKLGI